MRLQIALSAFFLFFFASLSFAAQVCTTTTIPGGNNDFDAMSGLSDTNVIAAGENGNIYQWNGAAWSQMTTPTSEDLEDIFMLADGTAYATGQRAGGRGTLLYYNGSTWAGITAGAIPNQDLTGVWAYSPTEVYVVGESGSIVTYNGTTWTDLSGTLPGQGNTDLEKVWGNASFVYVLDRDGVIYTYNRSTGVWSSNTLCEINNRRFRDLWVDTAGNVYVVAGNNGTGYIYRYNGSSCTLVFTASEELRGIDGSTVTGEIYAVGDNGAVVYFDTATWTESAQGNEDIRDTWVSDTGNAYHAAQGGEITTCIDDFSLTSASGSCSTMNQVTVVFSGAVDPVTAVVAANYSLDNGLTISGAALSGADTVTLTTSLQADATTYTLTVNNVEDLSGNVIPAGSTASFSLNCSGLIAFYRMDEDFWDGTADEVADQSGNNLHGRSIGGVSTSEAKVCNGAILDGITLSYVEVADDPLLDIPEELTVSLWLKTNAIPAGGLKSILSKDQNYEFHIDSGGHIYWWWNNTGGTARTLTTAATIAVDTWHHVAIVYSRSAALQQIYIDGVPDVNTRNYSEALFNDNQPLQIGGDQAFVTREFDGLIDEIRIYERAQSQAEIQADMNATRPCAVLSCGFRDNFTSIAYSNQDGALNWAADWIETNDDNNPAGGDAYIAAGSLVLNNDTGGGTMPELTRELDLTGASAATLSFIFSTSAGVDNGDSFRVQVSGNGGATWTTLETVNGNNSPKTESRSYPIDAFISTNTRIRLLIQSGYTNTDEDVYFHFVNVAPVGLCGGNVDHYAISHDGGGITCQAEPVTVSVHDGGHTVITTHTGSITLSTGTGHGDWSVVSGNPANLVNSGNGGGTYTFDGSESGSVVLGLKDTFVESANINVTDGSATELTGAALAAEDLPIAFAEAGFNFLANGLAGTIGAQIGGKASNIAPGIQTLELQAIRTSDETGQCEAALVGANAIDLAFECLDPPTCTAAPVNISGTNIAANDSGAVVSYTPVSLDFGDNTDTTATYTLTYPEVGRIQLHARYNIPLGNGPASGNLLLGNSNAFVVRPFAFEVSATGNPAAATAAGMLFTSAGALFQANVRAVLWQAADDLGNDGIPDNHDDTNPANNADLADNPAALNFGQETVPENVALTASLFLPGGGNNPALAGTTTVTGFTNGVSSANVRYDEVGIIELIANLPDNSYLGDGSVTGRSGHVGRFSPADFNVSVAPDPPTLINSCVAGGFTYLGQPFNFTVNPTITITARNSLGATTTNYDCGAFWKLPEPYTLNYTFADSSGAGQALSPLLGTTNPAAGETTDCNGSISVTVADSLTYARPAVTTPVQPFAAGVDLAANAAQFTDSDGVCFGAGCQPFTRSGITGANLRHGRSTAANAYGPETATGTNPLVMPITVDYYDNSPAWIVNPNDSCTSFSYVITPNGTITVGSSPVSPVTTSGGIGNLSLWPTADPAPAGGSVDLNYDFPLWLDDFAVEAFFGIYRGNDRIINWREIVR